MLTDGDTIVVGDVTFTWSAATSTWTAPAAPSFAAVSYEQELITPAIRPVSTTAQEPPPMVYFTRSYEYLKQDTGNPSAGQIMHLNADQGLLRIHETGQGGQDNGSLLAALQPDDEIVLDSTLWTVVSVSQFEAGAPKIFDVRIEPEQQSPLSGVVDFIFRRPNTA